MLEVCVSSLSTTSRVFSYFVFVFFFFIFESQIERVHSPIPRLGGRCKGQPRVNKTENFCFFSRLFCCYFLYAQTYLYVYCTVYSCYCCCFLLGFLHSRCLCLLLFIYLWHMPKRIYLRSNLYCVHTDNADSSSPSSSTCDVLRCYFSTISV